MRRGLWPIAGIAVALCSAAAVWAGSDLKDWHKSEASLLLTKDEQKEFKKLKDDAARQKWIDEFWKKLDPTPDAAPNEAQETFNKRVEMVRKSLGEEGWDTDMGKVLIVIGPPASSKKEGGESKGGQTVEEATGPEASEGNPAAAAAATDSSATGGGVLADGETAPSARRPKTVLIWTYKEGTPGLGSNTELRFESVGGKVSLKTKDVDLSRATFVASLPKPGAAAPPAVAAGQPGPTPAAGQQPAPPPQDPATAEMVQILKDKKLSSAIALQAEPYFFPSPDGNVYLPISLQADLSSLPAGAAGAARPVHVFGAFYKDGAVVRDFALAYNVPAGPAKALMTKYEVVTPGTYELYIGIRDDASGTYGLIEAPVQTPDFSKICTSSILVSHAAPEQTAPLDNVLDLVTDAVHLGPYKFQPYFGHTLKTTDTLNLFYFVMKTGGDAAGNPKLSIHYELALGGEVKGKFSIPELASSVVAHPIDIAKLKLKPGAYDLKVEIKDAIGGSTLNQTVPLKIE
jgi:GWxTD domain-containing protein